MEFVRAKQPAKWDRPPNFLLVDYYNEGNFPGSVFEVAAEMNNVTYNWKCCGKSSDAASMIYAKSEERSRMFLWGIILLHIVLI